MSSEKQRSTKSARPHRSRRTGTAKTPRTEARTRARKPLVLITGTGGLLYSYAAALTQSPYDVAVLLPRGAGIDARLPRDVKPFLRLDRRASIVIDVTLGEKDTKRRSLENLDRFFAADTVILTNAFALSVTEQASWIKGRHRLLGIGLLPGLLDGPLVEIAPSTHTLTRTVEAARSFFRACGKATEIVEDRAGLVSARVICQLINEAAFALQDDIARPEDIDTAMKLGVSFPHGPFEWAERIGIDNVVSVLEAMFKEYHEERYRVAPLLKRMALGGVWWEPPSASDHVGDAQ